MMMIHNNIHSSMNDISNVISEHRTVLDELVYTNDDYSMANNNMMMMIYVTVVDVLLTFVSLWYYRTLLRMIWIYPILMILFLT